MIKYGSSLAGKFANNQTLSRVSLEDELSQLDQKERDFCLSQKISCKDFLAVKQKILFEQAKNTALSHKILKERGHEVAAMDRVKADVIFDFIVKDMTKTNQQEVAQDSGEAHNKQ